MRCDICYDDVPDKHRVRISQIQVTSQGGTAPEISSAPDVLTRKLGAENPNFFQYPQNKKGTKNVIFEIKVQNTYMW